MSSIKLNGNQAGAAALMYADNMKELSNLIEQLNSRRSTCFRMGKDFGPICTALDKTILKLGNSKQDLGSLKNGLVNIAATYTSCEMKLAGIEVLPGVAEAIAAGVSVTEDTPYKPDWWKLAFGIVSAGGTVGDLIGIIGGEITDNDGITVGEGVDLFGKLVGYVGEGMKLSQETDIEWGDFLFGLKGLDESLELASGATGWDAFEAFFTKKGDALSFKDAKAAANGVSKTGETLASAAEWIGYAATFVTNAFDNYDEYKDGGITGERAVRETIVETGVDIGLGMLATAGVGAACVALGFAGAPAIVVGAAAAGAVWVANTVCEWATDTFFGEAKDIGEVVADAFCDLEDKVREVRKEVVNTVVDAGKAVADAAVDAGKAVADWFKSLW